MGNEFQSIQLERPKVLRDQIREAVRDLILAKKILPGEQMPSVRALAKMWNANVGTVHTALSALEKEGLLVQRHGKGTFVRKRAARLQCVGIYYHWNIWTDDYAGFRRKVHEALQELLHADGIELSTWVDSRPRADQSKPWPPLVQAIADGKVQAVVVPVVDPEHLSWQRKLPVPVAVIGSDRMPGAVTSDLDTFVDRGVKALAAQGCRSLGLITALLPQEVRFFTRFVDRCRDAGCAVRNDWIFMVKDWQPGWHRWEEFGYESFATLWSRRQRPDGLLVYPDSIVRGLMMALLERGGRVPQELKLVLHKNERVDLFCPVAATLAVLREREVAAALLAQLDKQFRGERCEPICLPFRLMAHPAVERTHGGTRPAAEPTRAGTHAATKW